MQPEIINTVAEVFSKVSETFAFLFSDQMNPSEVTCPEERLFSTDVHFHGPIHGKIELIMGESICHEINANVLAAEPDPNLPTDQLLDGAKELLNIYCGNLVTAIAGADPIFDVTIPTAAEVTSEYWRTCLGSTETAVVMAAENRPVLIRLTMEEAAANAA